MPQEPATQVHIVHGEYIAQDYSYYWVVGVFASKEVASKRVAKLERLLAKLVAKPSDQYARHRETWAPLDPRAHQEYVEHYYVSQDTLSWNITSHEIQ